MVASLDPLSFVQHVGHFSATPDHNDTVGSGYDAVKSKNARRIGSGVLRSEDDELRSHDRKKLLSGTWQLYRNFALLRWMLARHLDYVSTFSFQAKTKNRDLNKQLERLVARWSRRGEFEVSGRFGRQKFMRLAEQHRTLSGDFGVLKLRSGMVQGIEGDRIRTPHGGLPPSYTPSDFIHGVRTNDYGRHLEYSVCRRGELSDAGGGSSRFQFERIIPARNLTLFGYWDRFDQVRGVSPLASAMNNLVDCYESFDYALQRQKISQIIGMIFKLGKNDDPLTQVADGQEGQADTGAPKYGKVQWGGGSIQLELDHEDELEQLESKNPSGETQAFWTQMIQLALKALDIPYSFFAENYSNYSGARQALLQYEESAKIKRNDLRELLDHLTHWRLMLYLLDGELPGVSIDDLRWEWIPSGLPWIDPLKEVTADITAIGAGLTSRTQVLRERGGRDFYDVVDEIADENAYLDEKKLSVSTSVANVTIEEVAAK